MLNIKFEPQRYLKNLTSEKNKMFFICYPFNIQLYNWSHKRTVSRFNKIKYLPEKSCHKNAH